MIYYFYVFVKFVMPLFFAAGFYLIQKYCAVPLVSSVLFALVIGAGAFFALAHILMHYSAYDELHAQRMYEKDEEELKEVFAEIEELAEFESKRKGAK